MSNELRALTPRQWDSILGVDVVLTPADWPRNRDFWKRTFIAHRDDWGDYHGLAALCLYDTPYGFTERDLHDLDICLLGRDPIPGTHLHRIKLLRDRIAALLPPADSL